MGCDIHAYIEYQRNGETRYLPFGGRINPGRNYRLFGLLADLRECGPAIIEPRGMPPDAAWEAEHDNELYISANETDGTTTPERAQRWVESGSSVYLKDKHFVTHPDWHSHSWLTTAEYRDVLKVYQSQESAWPIPEYDAILAAMERLDHHGTARLVFWFDN